MIATVAVRAVLFDEAAAAVQDAARVGLEGIAAAGFFKFNRGG